MKLIHHTRRLVILSLRRSVRVPLIGPLVRGGRSALHRVRVRWTTPGRSVRFAEKFQESLASMDSGAPPMLPPSQAAFPDAAVVEINNTCNINCLMCNTQMAERPKGFIDNAFLEGVLRELKREGIETVEVHTIGDPLAHPRLPEVMDTFRRVRMALGLSTNGLLIERHLPALIRNVDLVGSIRFSIDGATQHTYEHIRAGGKWDVLWHNLRLTQKYLEPAGYTISVNMVVSKENVHEVGLFVDTFRDVFDPRRMTFGFVNSLSPDTSYFHSVNLFPQHTVPNKPCSLPFNSFWVHIDGRVSSCCRDYHGEVIVGDLSQQSVRGVWEGAGLEKLRSAHLRGQVQDYRLCENCHVVDPRINDAFSAMMSYMLWSSPAAPADYYQDWVNRFVDSIGSDRPLSSRLAEFSGLFNGGNGRGQSASSSPQPTRRR